MISLSKVSSSNNKLPTDNNHTINTMALVKAQKAILVLAEETALTTVDKLAEFLATKIEFDDDMKQTFDEFKTALKEEYKASSKASGKKKTNADGTEKKKRAPTPYNLFIKDQIVALKQDNPSWTGKELMAAATAAWKAQKQ